MRMKNGKEAMPGSKGKTNVKIAKKVGVSRHKVSVGIGLWNFDNRLIDIGLLGQLDEESACEYNSLKDSKKTAYLNWFWTILIPTAILPSLKKNWSKKNPAMKVIISKKTEAEKLVKIQTLKKQ